jgi:hypothetical protein
VAAGAHCLHPVMAGLKARHIPARWQRPGIDGARPGLRPDGAAYPFLQSRFMQPDLAGRYAALTGRRMVAGIHTQGVAIGLGYDGLSALAAAAAAVETRCIASPHGSKRRYPANSPARTALCVSAVAKPPVLASAAKQSRKEAAWTASYLAVTFGADCVNSNHVNPLILRIPVQTMNSLAVTL